MTASSPSLRVGINARLLTEPSLRGWNRYTVNLLAELAGLGVELVLYSVAPIHPDHLARLPDGSYRVRLGEGMRLGIWEQRWLPRQCRRDGVDVLHATFNYGLPWSSPCPRVLTLHDAIDFAYYGRGTPPWRRLLGRGRAVWLYHWISRARAERVITVSEHAKGDLVGVLGVSERKLRVTHEAADPQFHRPVTEADRLRARAAHALPRRYVFYVGGWEKRKNIPSLVRALAEADLDDVSLVLAGGRADQRAELTALADSCGLGADRLHLLGWVEDTDLPALYAEALAFAYPSEYEGFGLQLCEAMAVGCPILAARATSLPEILGDGGAMFDPHDSSELAALLRRLATDTGFREDLSAKARARSTAFSWRRTAEQTLEVYRELVSG